MLRNGRYAYYASISGILTTESDKHNTHWLHPVKTGDGWQERRGLSCHPSPVFDKSYRTVLVRKRQANQSAPMLIRNRIKTKIRVGTGRCGMTNAINR